MSGRAMGRMVAAGPPGRRRRGFPRDASTGRHAPRSSRGFPCNGSGRQDLARVGWSFPSGRKTPPDLSPFGRVLARDGNQRPESRSGARRRLGAASVRIRGDGRRENVAAGVYSVVTGHRPGISVRWRSVRAAEATGLLHLAKEEEKVDLLERPVGLADRDARQVGREVGRLFRRHAPQQETAVGRSGGQARPDRWRRHRGRRVGDRPRHGPGGRREDRP